MITDGHKQGFWENLYYPSALSDAIEYISEQLNPEDIFEKKQLEKWALDNGFTKEPK